MPLSQVVNYEGLGLILTVTERFSEAVIGLLVHSGHASCLKLSPAIIQTVKLTRWQCQDCKTCTVCKASCGSIKHKASVCYQLLLINHCILSSNFLPARRSKVVSLLRQRVCLGGWLSVTADTVLKQLNLSENFFDHLVAPS